MTRTIRIDTLNNPDGMPWIIEATDDKNNLEITAHPTPESVLARVAKLLGVKKEGKK